MDVSAAWDQRMEPQIQWTAPRNTRGALECSTAAAFFWPALAPGGYDRASASRAWRNSRSGMREALMASTACMHVCHLYIVIPVRLGLARSGDFCSPKRPTEQMLCCRRGRPSYRRSFVELGPSPWRDYVFGFMLQ